MFDRKNAAATLEKPTEVSPQGSSSQEVRTPSIDHQNIMVIKKISKTKFPVYLATSKTSPQNYALKLFFHTEDAPSPYFHNEIRFALLKHPNVVNIVHYEDTIEILHRKELKKCSYILMEYAPYKDFFDFILKYNSQMDEKLIRTYFRQLIEGIEYLHRNRIAHLDLKPENLLIGTDFNLKIADFDLSYVHGDSKVLSRGTRCYRAPELYTSSSGSAEARLDSLFAADIYSAGIILYLLKSGGVYPHCEEKQAREIDFQKLMYKDNKKFWKEHCEMEGKRDSFYDRNFRQLFNNMVKFNPFERFNIDKVKNSKWYKGPVYSPEELQDKVKKMMFP